MEREREKGGRKRGEEEKKGGGIWLLLLCVSVCNAFVFVVV